MLSTADLIAPPLAAFVVATGLGLALATLRAPRTGAGWLTLDALVLLPIFLPAPLLARAVAASGWPDLAWPLAATLAALPFAYLPVRLALARSVATYRDTAALLGYGCLARLWRIDLPLIWPALLLALLFAFTRVAAEWFLVIANLEQFTALTAVLLALILGSAVAVGSALTRPVRA